MFAIPWQRILERVRFQPNEVRLQLGVLAYNLGNLWRRLGLPQRIKSWSQTSLQSHLMKTGRTAATTARPRSAGSSPYRDSSSRPFNSSHVFGFHSRARRCVSAICSAVIVFAMRSRASRYSVAPSPLTRDAARFNHLCAWT